jgi:hypothetical protein
MAPNLMTPCHLYMLPNEVSISMLLLSYLTNMASFSFIS